MQFQSRSRMEKDTDSNSPATVNVPSPGSRFQLTFLNKNNIVHQQNKTIQLESNAICF